MFTIMNLISSPYLKIMLQLANDPMRDFYQREIAGTSRVSIGATNGILRELVRARFLTQRKRGKMYFYKLNLENPTVTQFKVLLNVDNLTNLIDAVKDHTRKVVLFGSSAQGTDVKESDIDLFVLTGEKNHVRRMVSGFNAKHERKIAPIIVDANGFVKLKKDDRPLYENIERGITLWETK